MAKYWWGSDDSFPMKILFLAILLGGFTVGIALSMTEPSGPAISAGVSLASVKLSVLATLVYYFVYYQAIGAQVMVRMAMGNDLPATTNTATRSLNNTLEQMPLFLVLLWLYTIYGDATIGGVLGFLYAGLTLLYLFAYASYGHFTVNCEFCTQPRYTILTFFALELLCLCFGGSYYTVLPKNVVLLGLWMFVQECLWMNVCWSVFGVPIALVNNRANPKPPQDAKGAMM